MASERQMRGRLVFKDELYDGELVPLHGVDVQVWSGALFLRRKVGETVADLDGRFVIELDGHRGQSVDLRVVTFDRTYDPRKGPKLHEHEVWKQTVRLADEPDLGTFYVPYWPYRSNFPLPRADRVHGHLPQQYTWGLWLRQKAVELWWGARTGVVLAETEVDFQDDDLSDIQNGYPKNDTRLAGHARSRSDEWLGERVLNGHNPCLLARDARDPSRWRMKIGWNVQSQDEPEWDEVPSDGVHDLTDVDATFALQGDTLVPVEINLEIHRAFDDGWTHMGRSTCTPADPDLWEQAKRVFRTHYMLAGELDAHLLKAHMRVEQYALAAHRHLRQNPVGVILRPHLHEIVPTNAGGDTIAWGDLAVICQATAMKAEWVRKRMVRLSRGMDWKTWRPRQPVCTEHRFARTANLYWDVLDEYVTRFVHENEASIRRHWGEIRHLSRDLVANSLPYAPEPDDPDLVWTDRNELDDPNEPRERYEGLTRAVRPVTARDVPQSEDLEALQDFCRFVIYHATFYHAWVHDRQWADGGEILYAGLALRNGSLGSESDKHIAPKNVEASYGLLTLIVGRETRYGYVMKDEDRNVPPLLERTLDRHRSSFQALGYDLDTALRSRVNI